MLLGQPSMLTMTVLNTPPVRATPLMSACNGEYPGPPPRPPPHVVAPPAQPLGTTLFIGGAGGNYSDPGVRTELQVLAVTLDCKVILVPAPALRVLLVTVGRKVILEPVPV